MLYGLDKSPIVAAEMLCDDHVSMAAEHSARVLGTVSRNLREAAILELSEQIMQKSASFDTVELTKLRSLEAFKEAVAGLPLEEPWVQWTLRNELHCQWVALHGRALITEYSLRFKDSHEMAQIIWETIERGRFTLPRDLGQTPFGFTQLEFPVDLEAARVEYAREFGLYAKWSRPRKPPYWWPYKSVCESGTMGHEH